MACKPWHDGALPLSGPIWLLWLLFSWFHCFWPPLSSLEPWERILSLPSGLFAPLSTCLYPLTSGLTSQKPECNEVPTIFSPCTYYHLESTFVLLTSYLISVSHEAGSSRRADVRCVVSPTVCPVRSTGQALETYLWIRMKWWPWGRAGTHIDLSINKSCIWLKVNMKGQKVGGPGI